MSNFFKNRYRVIFTGCNWIAQYRPWFLPFYIECYSWVGRYSEEAAIELCHIHAAKATYIGKLP
jgi:hypothetical protein